MTHHRPNDGMGVVAWMLFGASLFAIAVFAFIWSAQTFGPM